MIARVIPLRSLPRGHDQFDYALDKEQEQLIAVDAEVIVPLRGRLERAVVWSCHEPSTSVKLKSIHAIVNTVPVLTNIQHQSIDWIIKTSGGSRTTLVRPLVSVQRGLHLAPSPSPREETGTTIIVSDYASLAKELRHIVSTRSTNGAMIIVAPTLQCLAAVHDVVRSAMRPHETLMMLHGRSSIKEHRHVAAMLSERNALVLVSTKIGLLAPWGVVAHIVVCHPSSDHYKQWDREPRYDARELAAMLSKAWRIPLTILSSSPPVIQWQDLNDEMGQSRRKTLYQSATPSAPSWEHWESLLPRWWEDPEHPMLSVLTSAQRRHRSVVILYNERSMRAIAFCRECRHPWRCEGCSRVLYTKTQTTTLDCSFCTHPLIPSACSHCGCPTTATPYRSRMLPALIESMAQHLPVRRIRAISELFAPEPVIACVDIQHMEDILGCLWRSHVPKEIPASLLVWDLPALGQTTGYQSAEHQWHILEHCAQWADAWRIPKRIVVGFLEEHIKDAISSRDPLRFYQKELILRERYHYPPHRDLILLDEHLKAGQRSCLEKLLPQLRTLLPDSSEVSAICNTMPRRQRYSVRKCVLVKILPHQRERVMEVLTHTLPSSISIDYNPIHGI